MPDYSNGKIYKIECNITNDVYYGSTRKSLSDRMRQHKTTRHCTSIKIIDRGNYTCKIIEEYPCNSRLELETRERWWIENNVCINKSIPTRTAKEYQQDNKEQITQQRKQHYQDNREYLLQKRKEYQQENKEQIAQYNKEYQQDNKEQLAQQRKEYYEQNKEQIAQKKKEKVTCECGAIVRKSDIAKHCRTQNHLNLMSKDVVPAL